MGMGKAIITKINTFDPVPWKNEKKGTSGMRYPVSVLIKEQWYSNSFFSEVDLNEFKKINPGQEKLIVLSKKHNENNPAKPFYNFRWPTKEEENGYRIDELEERIALLEKKQDLSRIQ